MTTKFNTWLDTFLNEKGINLEDEIFTCDIGGDWGTCTMEGAILLEGLNRCPKTEQHTIRNMIVRIDFENQPVMPYFQHLATALAKNQFNGEQS